MRCMIHLVKKEEVYVRFRNVKSDRGLKEYIESKKEFKQEIRGVKRGHKMTLARS